MLKIRVEFWWWPLVVPLNNFLVAACQTFLNNRGYQITSMAVLLCFYSALVMVISCYQPMQGWLNNLKEDTIMG